MSETGFVCPNCGHSSNFIAQAMVVTGAIDIGPDGYEPRYGSGINSAIPDDARMLCPKCTYESTAFEFGKAQSEVWNGTFEPLMEQCS